MNNKNINELRKIVWDTTLPTMKRLKASELLVNLLGGFPSKAQLVEVITNG